LLITSIEFIGILIGLFSLLLGTIAINLALEIRKEEREIRTSIDDSAQRDLDYFQHDLVLRIHTLNQHFFNFQKKIKDFPKGNPSPQILKSLKMFKKIFDDEFEPLWIYYESRRHILNSTMNNNFTVLKQRKKSAEELFDKEIEEKNYGFWLEMYMPVSQGLLAILDNFKNVEFKTDDLESSTKKTINESIEFLQKYLELCNNSSKV